MKPLIERVTQLESVLPQSATIADIKEAQQLLKEISASDLLIRVRLLLKIGSFYLGSKAFDLNSSIETAKSYYQQAAKIGYQENNNQWLIYGASGIANCYAEEYKLSGNQEHLIHAKKIYEENIIKCEENGMTEEANSNRMNYSLLLQNAKHGDRFSNNDQAITMIRQVLENSSQEALRDRFNPDFYARTLYNLGVALQNQSEEPHINSLYLNEAVDCFQKVLPYRPEEKDRLGRARVFRALARLYPEWEGADSPMHAQQLAEAALTEAIRLESMGNQQEKAGWAIAKESTSALNWSIDDLVSVAQNRESIIAEIECHRLNINRIPREQMQLLWADWVGGYAVLVGCVGIEDNNRSLIKESYNAFVNAVDAVSGNDDQHLLLKLFRELGKVCHVAGEWEKSLLYNKKVAEIGLNLTDNAGTDISRTNELESFTRAIHFAAFAAAKLNLGEEAAELAEIGRARWMDEAIIISSIRLSSLSPEFKSKIDTIQASILELERQEHKLQNEGVSGMGRQMENLFGIPFGDAEKMRKTADPNGIEAKRILDLANVRAHLQELHEEINQQLNSIKDDEIISKHPTFDQIKKIVQAAGFPLVYLLSSAWGSTAIIVNKNVEIVPIPELTRDEIQKLLHAKNGYLNSVRNSNEELEKSLEYIQNILDKYFIPPIVSWCERNEIHSLGIIGLGDIGLLPIQISTVPVGLSIRLLPSARALNLSLPQKKINDPSKMRLLTIGDMNSNGLLPLKYSGIESLFFSNSFHSVKASVYDNSNELTLASVEAEINTATHVHFSCHGNFAPFSPLNSVLYLDGDEKLPIENLLRPTLRLLGTELVILSACNSASIENWRTPDETIGFPAAFLVAGAKTVIAAQWPVSDSATFLLMQQFCKELLSNSFDAARSLANSQLWLQKATKQEIQFALIQVHDSLGNNEMRAKRLLKELQVNIESLSNEYPFKDRQFWAGFVCVGA
jgi:CHAT domain-containing protein